MIKAIIIDDESRARGAIRSIVEARVPEVKIVAEANSVSSAIGILREEDYQLVFLDINLPDGNGFDILKKVESRKFRTIFITAHQEFAIQAIKFSALDYILKPINPDELIAAVQNCINDYQEESQSEKIATFFSNYHEQNPEFRKLVLKTAERIQVVDTREIIRCEADNVYTTFYLQSDQRIIVSRSIKSYEEILKTFRFMRVHQSHLVNLNFISYFDKTDGGFLVLMNNTQIPVSAKKKPLLLDYLNRLGR